MSELTKIESMLKEKASKKLEQRLNAAFQVPYDLEITCSEEEIGEFLNSKGVPKTKEMKTNTLLKYLSEMIYNSKIEEYTQKETIDFVENVYELKNQLAGIDDLDNSL